MALVLVAALSLAWILDLPFDDRGAMIGPERIQRVMLDMEQGYGFPASTIPCSSTGQARA